MQISSNKSTMNTTKTVKEHYENFALTIAKGIMRSTKQTFSIEDAHKSIDILPSRARFIIEALLFLKTNPLFNNDYYKYVHAYQQYGKKLKEKYFKHDIVKLHQYYDDVDKNDKRPFSRSKYEDYVLYMTLKLNGIYEKEDDIIFNVLSKGSREYNPLTAIPSVLRSLLPFEVHEYDIKKAFPSFIDLELGIDRREKAYEILDKKTFSLCVNSNHEKGLNLQQARLKLLPIYGANTNKVLSQERYEEKGKFFKDLAPYEKEYIDKFVEKNSLKNFVRLHDGVFMKKDVECKEIKFGKIEFVRKDCTPPTIKPHQKTFYSKVSADKYITSPDLYAQFFEQEGVIRITNPDDKIQLLKNENKIVKYLSHKSDSVSFLQEEINEINKEPLRNIIAKENNTKITQSFNLLPPIKLKYYKDSKSTFGLPFSNGFHHLSEGEECSVENVNYTQVDGFFSEHEIQEQHFHYTTTTGDFETFIKRISTGYSKPRLNQENKDTIEAFNSMIGYLVHNYKFAGESPCIILTDEGANDETRNGRRGKSLIGEALSHVTTTLLKGGNEFNASYIHNFADLKEEHSVYIIDDIPASFNFHDLYTNISGGISVQQKGLKAFQISRSNSPKFLITSNWLLRKNSNDDSTNARFVEYKIKPYYSSNRKPTDEFDTPFFEWNQDEWSRFYSYIFRCVHTYLNKGLIQIQYDKEEDNYMAHFGLEAKEQEMRRLINLMVRRKGGFNVSAFLKEYKNSENPLRFEKYFTTNNSKNLINVFLLKHSPLSHTYDKAARTWRKVT